ncbi:MAG: DNA polymerase IV [Clostridia bacterium]|nr:DNA polymerase IV [Clostridia bacterium]
MRLRVILHSDLNNFFASVETVLNPELAGKPLIVCGDPKERRGVVLAKNELAKRYGIKTAETVVSALKKCPHVQRVSTHFGDYRYYSEKVREIYERFTDVVEECSIDECSLDVTASQRMFGGGVEIAEKIRRAVKEELGLTVSIGVSYNKIYAKLASEIKKPDAVTEIPYGKKEQIVYPLPVTDLLYVGKATAQTLSAYGIRTIGELANADESLVSRLLGKRGRLLRKYARGEDDEPVKTKQEKDEIKSIGNSSTLPASLTDREEIKRWFYVLAESVTGRLRDADVGRANTVHIVVRDDNLEDKTWQTKVTPTLLCSDVAQTAYKLFCENWGYGKPVRMLGITVSGFDHYIEQMTIGDVLGEREDYKKKERVEDAVAKIRKKYGFSTLQRGVLFADEKLSGLDIRKESQPRSEKPKIEEKED